MADTPASGVDGKGSAYHGVEIEDEEPTPTALDLAREARTLADRGETWERGRIVLLDREGMRLTELPEILYCPESGRAGIAWGAEATWTDADSIEDGAQRWARGEMVE